MGECITRLPKTQADESSEQLHWRKRLDVIPKRLSEELNGDSLEFDRDTRRWRRRIRYYKEVRTWYFFFHNPLLVSFSLLRFSHLFNDYFYMVSSVTLIYSVYRMK